MKSRLIIQLFLISALLAFCGCADISDHSIIQGAPPPANPAAPDSPLPETEAYQSYTFSEDDELFIERSVFIGDSIFAAFTDNGMLEGGHVLAKKGARTSDIAEARFPMPSGDEETELLTALVNINPDNIVILLGTNDVGVTEIEDYCEDYMALIRLIKTYRADSAILALSIPPVRSDVGALGNLLITEYNAALQAAIKELRDEQVRFINIGEELGNSHGRLKSRFAQEDGVHLTSAGLYAVLWQVCNS